jgi:hypothetical protein
MSLVARLETRLKHIGIPDSVLEFNKTSREELQRIDHDLIQEVYIDHEIAQRVRLLWDRYEGGDYFDFRQGQEIIESLLGISRSSNKGDEIEP